MEDISFLGVGLAVDDWVFKAKQGVEYRELLEKVKHLPKNEGNLTPVQDFKVFTEVLESMVRSGLFIEDANGYQGMQYQRNMGGGLNALTFAADYARTANLPPVAGVFALGKEDSKPDESAEYIINNSENHGIAGSPILIDGRTPKTIVIQRMTDKGNQRTFIHGPGVADGVSSSQYIQAVKASDMLPMAACFYYLNICARMNAEGAKGIKELYQFLQSMSVVTVLDSAGSEEEMRKKGYQGTLGSGVLAHTDIFAPGGKEIQAILGGSCPEDHYVMFESQPPVYVEKLGPAGNIVFGHKKNGLALVSEEDWNSSWRGRSHYTPATLVDNVDSVLGAGDRSLMAGIMYIIDCQVNGKPISLAAFSDAIAAGGAISVSGQKLTKATLESTLRSERPMYL